MKKYLVGGFLLVILAYHVLHTFFGYWIDLVAPTLLSWIKDLLRVLLVGGVCWWQRKAVCAFFRDRKRIILAGVILIAWSLVLSREQGMSRWSMLIWFKYDIYPLVVLVSALVLWYVLQHNDPNKWFVLKKNSYLTNFLLIVLSIGLVWQWIKFWFPDFFMWFGYGPVGDYVLWNAPPIRYRTWPGGMMRLQWIFAGPNNYGFFLVGIAGLVTFALSKQPIQRKKILLWWLYMCSLWWTLSRGAWIGAGVTIALTIRWFFPAYKKLLVWWWIVGMIGVLWITLIKTWSTSGHWIALWEGIQAFLAQPWWYGLGMAWPSIHYTWVYLPENHYMQILLDLWIPWLLLWWGIFLTLLQKSWKKVTASPKNESINRLVVLLFFGICGLVVEGLFLHVWEDSMVNYLLLGTFGIVVWMLSSACWNAPSIIDTSSRV